MNVFALIASILAAFSAIGHFTMGSKQFMKPILNSDADSVPKKVMHALFHYMSAFLVFTALVMFSTSMGTCMLFPDTTLVLKFIGIMYALFSFVAFIVAVTSKIEGGLFKIFQWILWALIAVFSLLGV